MTLERRCLSLRKGREHFVFRYEAGCEAALLAALVELAADPRWDFDWFDAAVLSYQMGRRREPERSAVH
jgi:hypothetical protein